MRRGCTTATVAGGARRSDRMEAGAARAGKRARADAEACRSRSSPSENQAIWIEIYIDRARTPGVYRGTIEIRADGARRIVPIELEVFDFTLPDENSMHAMLFYSSDQPELYHGRNLDAAYHRLAHRHRVELVHAYDEQTLPTVWGRFSGADFTRERGYEGPGAGHRQRDRPANVLRPRAATSTIARPPGRAATRG